MTRRIPTREVVGYSAGSVGTGGFGTLPGLVLAYYLTDTLAVPALMASIVVIVPKVWDVVIDPAIGSLSDTEATRRGTRTRVMAFGALTLPIGFIGMFAVPTGWAPNAAAGWVLIFFVLATSSFSLFQVPYIALPAELTDGYRERTRLMSWRIATLTLTILLVGAGGPAIRDAAGGGPSGYLVMGVLIAALVLIGMLAAVWGMRRHRISAPTLAPTITTAASYSRAWDVIRHQGAYRVLLGVFVLQALAIGIMLAAAQYVATYVLGSPTALTFLFLALVGPALIVMPLWTRYAAVYGKPHALRTASLGFFVATIALLGMLVAPGWWVYAAVALAGVAYAGMQLFPLSMLPDVITAAGRERGGTMSGVWTAGETAGLALGPSIVLVTLAVGGFQSSTAAATLVQPESAQVSIILAFSALPALLVAASLLVLTRYREPSMPRVGSSP
ncbi:MAG: MFS transporter [Ornithinimicrobium sp.]